MDRRLFNLDSSAKLGQSDHDMRRSAGWSRDRQFDFFDPDFDGPGEEQKKCIFSKIGVDTCYARL